jgi:hypothetical protein
MSKKDMYRRCRAVPWQVPSVGVPVTMGVATAVRGAVAVSEGKDSSGTRSRASTGRGRDR